MTIEQKAKAYDEALKVLHKYDGAHIMFTQDLKEEMFPELKESSDEQLRKRIIQALHGDVLEMEEISKCTAWLEKQDKQKPINKVEHKFEMGDWVVSPNGVYWHIDKISNNRYEVTSNTGESSNWPLDTNIYHRFTIQDAKDGDVLYNAEHNYILIYKHQKGTKDFVSSCRLCLNTYTFYSCEEFEWDDLIWNPATKEQRDTLMKAMADAGYSFDFEKKELKKIAQEPVIYKKQLMDEMTKCIETYIQQKPTDWSEEDEKVIHCLEYTVKHFYEDEDTIKWCCDWLKSIKDKVQPKQEWGEEDVRNIQDIDSVLFYDKSLSEDTCMRLRNWLKSLKPHKQWKPSDEQLGNLLNACNRAYLTSGQLQSLRELYEQLKQL